MLGRSRVAATSKAIGGRTGRQNDVLFTGGNGGNGENAGWVDDWARLFQEHAEGAEKESLLKRDGLNNRIVLRRAFGENGAVRTIPESMKPYVITTGVIFALITAAHIWRIIAESPRLLGDPSFVLLTVASGALAVWAWTLVQRRSRS